MNAASYRCASACFSDAGPVRDINEDSFLDLREKFLWVVADGMGGHERGQMASELIRDSLAAVAAEGRTIALLDEVEDRLLSVNRRLFELATSSQQPVTIGSTVVALIALHRHGVCLWAGDSRAYRLSAGVLEQVTRDHSEVQTLVEQGTIRAEEAELHPRANVINRAVGGERDMTFDAEIRPLSVGDRYLLCTDGLHREVTHAELAQALSSGSCVQACRSLGALALDRGCSDNVTLVVVDFLRAAGSGDSA